MLCISVVVVVNHHGYQSPFECQTGSTPLSPPSSNKSLEKITFDSR
ncbi:unnamed protein product, partial [Rotaria sp. Silwood1]